MLGGMGRLEIKPEEHAALVDGRPLSLTVRELQLLRPGLGWAAARRRSLRRRLRQPAAGEAGGSAARPSADPYPQRDRLPLLARWVKKGLTEALLHLFHISATQQ